MFELKKIVADFRTSLSAKISVGGTAGTIQNNLDDDGVVLPTGKYCFTFDLDNSQKEHITCDLSGKNLTNIKSVSRQGVETTGVLREHRIGASVSLTDFAYIKHLNDALNGDIGLNPAKRIKYDSNPVFTDSKELITKQYADSIASSGIIAMLVSDAGGVKVDINPGTYILNGIMKTYAGISGQSLTDDATNYIQISNGALLIDTTGFVDDSIPLASAICASGDITSLTDSRPFYTAIDLKQSGGIKRDANGIFIGLATSSGLNINESNQLEVKLKSGGGIIKDADGLWFDNPNLMFKCGEDITRGDLLKISNGEAVKISGIGDTISHTGKSKSGNVLKVKWASESKAIMLTDTHLFLLVFDGENITDVINITPASGSKDFDVLDENKVVSVRSYNSSGPILASVIIDISTTTPAFGTESTSNFFSGVSTSSHLEYVVALTSTKFVAGLKYDWSGGTNGQGVECYSASVSGTTISQIGVLTMISEGTQSYSSRTFPERAFHKIDDDNFIYGNMINKSSSYQTPGHWISVCIVNATSSTISQSVYEERLITTYNSSGQAVVVSSGNGYGYVCARNATESRLITFVNKSTSGAIVNSSINYQSLSEIKVDGNYLYFREGTVVYRHFYNNGSVLATALETKTKTGLYILSDKRLNTFYGFTNDTTINSFNYMLDTFEFVGIADRNYNQNSYYQITKWCSSEDFIQGGVYYIGQDGKISLTSADNKLIGTCIEDGIVLI